MTLAALDAVLADHEAGRARERVPVVRMLTLDSAEIEARARALAGSLATVGPAFTVSVEPGESAVGGGAAPTAALPTFLLALTHRNASPDELARALRTGAPAVLARIADGRLLLDLRTVFPEDDGRLREALVYAARALGGPPR
jgi:L-seryl-tRNA(Ser) seleniumtransferase